MFSAITAHASVEWVKGCYLAQDTSWRDDTKVAHEIITADNEAYG